MSRGLTFVSEMPNHSGPGPAEPIIAGEDERQAESAAVRGTDLRQQLRWVPLTAGLTTLIIGLGYIAEGLLPGLYHRRLRGLSDLAPGTLANLTRTSDVIIGLLLLMLSHGLRRRKRRAWAAVMALLAVGLVIHGGLGIFLHHLAPGIPVPRVHPLQVAISAALLIALYAYRRQFYAVGDRRSRWRALRILSALVVTDVVLGFIALTVIGGSSANYSFGQRLYYPHCRLVHVPAPGRIGPPVHARGQQPHQGTARAPWRQRPARLFHATHRQEHHLVADRQSLYRLPGPVRRDAGQR